MVILSLFEHRGDTQIKISFPYEERLKDLINQIPGTRWSQSKKAWYIKANSRNLNTLLDHLEIHVQVDSSKLSHLKQDILPQAYTRKIGKGRVNAKLFELAQLESMLPYLEDEQEKLLFICMMSAGLSVKELQQLKIEDIQKPDNSIILLQPGTGKTRKVFLAHTLVEKIMNSEHLENARPYLFGQGNQYYSEAEIKTRFRIAQRKIKITKPSSPLIMKRSFVDYMKKSTQKTSLVAKMITYRTHPVEFSTEEVNAIHQAHIAFNELVEQYVLDREKVG